MTREHAFTIKLEETDEVFPNQNAGKRHSETSLKTARSLANDPSLGGGG